jgi:hypothetical protein
VAASVDDYPPRFERTDIDGVKVVSDVVFVSPLTKYTGRFIAQSGTRVLTMEDGTVVHGCADCVFAGKLGQVRQHRNADHPEMSSGVPRRRHKTDASAGDEALEPFVVPRETLSMTMRDFFTTAALIDDWGTVLEQLERQVEELTEERSQLRADLRTVTRDRDSIRKKVAKAMGLDIITTPEES